jgi:galactose oxidase-like protein/Kelch motif protein
MRSTRPSASPSSRPRSDAWVPAGELRTARSNAHAVLVEAGEILVVGDDNVCAPASAGSDDVEVGDPLAKRWRRADPLPKPHDRLGLVALPDGRALLAGGLTGEQDGPSSFSSTYLFDPATRSWSRSGLLHTARSEQAMAVLPDGRVLVAGGMYIDRRNQADPRILTSSELWDPATGRWSATGDLMRTRFEAQATTLTDGRVLIVGGYGDADRVVRRSTAEIYDPLTGRWSAAGLLGTYRSSFVLTPLRGGGALVAGGSQYIDVPDSFPEVGPVASAERFDPTTGRWRETGPMRTAASGRAGAALVDGRVLVAGGDTTPVYVDIEPPDPEGPSFTDASEIYDPTMDTWAPTIALPRPRAGAEAVTMPDGSIVLVGGNRRPGPIRDTPSCPSADARVWRFVLGQ